MKKILLGILILNVTLALYAQDEAQENVSGFKKENVFTGGNLTVSFYTGGTALGVSPHLGYSFTKWLDAAVSLNFLYTGENDGFNTRYRQTVVGPGAFVRIFPVQFLFLQSQFEHNFLTLKELPPTGPSKKYKEDVNSLLLGAGYSSGRSRGNNSYYYISVMFDALKLQNSPYVDSRGRLIPVIRAGFNIALFQGKGEKF